MMSDYHVPVLLHDVINGLNIRPDGCYVDVTFGGGGHSREILKKLSGGKLYAFDQDADAASNVMDEEALVFVPQNFKFLKNGLRFHGVKQVDGVLADLGVSSHQFDVPERGFSFRFEGPLDMRMNTAAGKSAADVLNTYDEEELYRVFREYGELKGLKKWVEAIIVRRSNSEFQNTQDLVELHDGLQWGGQKRNRVLAQIFQALRIEVNDEMSVLKDFLEACQSVVKPGGRLVVVSYHSLEDRLVKNYIKSGSFDGKLEKDFFGNVNRPFKEVNRKVIVPSDEEIDRNPRARSAKLRIAEKL